MTDGGARREQPQRLEQRIDAIDRMRGLVMVLMVIDHASSSFNANHVFTDSAMFYAGHPLPTLGFLSRWITHLCAPSFVFLAGVAIALSFYKRLARGEPTWSFDRHLLLRGVMIASLDPLVMSVTFLMVLHGQVFFQVLFAIGASMVLMVPLRRLPGVVLVLASVAVLAVNESIVPTYGQVFGPAGYTPPPWVAVPMTGAIYSGEPLSVLVVYPVLPWLSFMMLGWVFGRWMVGQDRRRVSRALLLGGAGMLVAFLALRGFNGWGNTNLPRLDGSLVQWLHVSKYPPGVTFALLELGLMGVLMAGLLPLERAGILRPWPRDPLLVFGRTALFFYLLHVPILKAMAYGVWLLQGLDEAAAPPAHGLSATYIATAIALVLLYPLCTRYHRYKRAHPEGWTRYL